MVNDKKAPQKPRNKKTRKARVRLSRRAVRGVLSRVAPLGSFSSPEAKHCFKTYVLSLIDPFNPKLIGEVCYPQQPARKTQKYITSFTVTTAIGVQGNGYVVFDPTYQNDTNAVFYTGSTWDSSVTGNIATSGTGVSAANFSGPYATDSFTAGTYNELEGRVVSVGFRIRWRGKLVDRGGMVTPLIQQQQKTWVGTGIGDLQHYTQPKYPWPEDDGWIYRSAGPQHVPDSEFYTNTQRFPWSGGGTTAAPFLGFAFYGEPGANVLIEVVCHCEASGLSAVGARANALAPPEAVSGVNGAVNDYNTFGGTPSPTPSPTSLVEGVIHNIPPEVKRSVGNAFWNALMSYVSSGHGDAGAMHSMRDLLEL
jgi:hypothetical protein